jgi:glycosyltransferase involved in cell wall biosynthesis
MKRIAIVMPLYNDWASFVRLVEALDTRLAQRSESVMIVAVDDGSTEQPAGFGETLRGINHIGRIELIHLACNIGHQRAIAVGLVEIARQGGIDAVVVMDSDGEDRPEHVGDLLEMFDKHPGSVIVAHRTKRSEGWCFRLFYRLYKLLFRLLTGQKIDFGNFCLIPTPLLDWLIHVPDIWNNLAASIFRSRVPVVRLASARGARYAGQSKMNMVSLVIHGLSAVSVYSDVAFVRILMAALCLSALTVVGIVIVVVIRLFTDLAIPGWASNVAGSLMIMLFQALMFSAGAAFLVLANRSSPSIIPLDEARRYVRDRRVVFER